MYFGDHLIGLRDREGPLNYVINVLLFCLSFGAISPTSDEIFASTRTDTDNDRGSLILILTPH